MRTTTKPFLTLTASDLMTREVVQLPQEMSLRGAARIFMRDRISGAPVVDGQGKCVGVLSAIDFLRLVEKQDEVNASTSSSMPISCSFQAKQRSPGGKEITTCTLPLGACAVQVKEIDSDGKETVICSQPHCVLADWQTVEMEKLPTDQVRHYMTADPVTVPPSTSITTLARLMIDAHIHRVIVVDGGRRPIGIVSSTDILAAVADAGGG